MFLYDGNIDHEKVKLFALGGEYLGISKLLSILINQI